MAKEEVQTQTLEEGTDAGDSTSTLSPREEQQAFSPEAIAEKPEMKEAFGRVFGKGAGKGKTTSGRQSREETTEEIEDDPDADLDDGVDRSLDGKDGTEDAGNEGDEAPEGGEANADNGDGKNKSKAGDAPKELTLPVVLRQAAKRAGWSDEDIDAFFEINPEKATDTFSHIHTSVNDLSAQYARLGQQALQQQQQKVQSEGDPKNNLNADALEAIYGKERLAKLSEEYDQGFIDNVVRPLVEPVRQMMDFFQQQQQQAMAAEIGGFFKGLPAEYSDLYGGDKITDQQQQTRMVVAQLADQIRRGAMDQGFQMSVSEALSRANLIQSAQHLQTIERQRLTAQVRSRSKQITHRPTQRRAAGSGGGNRPSKQTAADAYAQRAAELGMNVEGE